ncbi:hypothetical protein [Micromonospora sp. KC723]|uniref:hypothetical protein n=1 Tax=Micromonospora sp. KC723 TaxID=2530381 RepID=UPI00352F80B0
MTEPATVVTAATRPAPSKPSPSPPPGGIAFPHAQQAVRITRTRTVTTRTSRETAYLTMSLPAGQAQPVDLQTWIRRHWHIENKIHHVRDMTFREDLHQARTGNGPAVIATLHNTAIGRHHTTGATNIARATCQANRRSFTTEQRRRQVGPPLPLRRVVTLKGQRLSPCHRGRGGTRSPPPRSSRGGTGRARRGPGIRRRCGGRAGRQPEHQQAGSDRRPDAKHRSVIA